MAIHQGKVAPNDQIRALTHTAWAVYLFPIGAVLGFLAADLEGVPGLSFVLLAVGIALQLVALIAYVRFGSLLDAGLSKSAGIDDEYCRQVLWQAYHRAAQALMLTLAIAWLLGEWLLGVLSLTQLSFNTLAGLMLLVGVFTWSTSILVALGRDNEVD